MGRTIEMGTPKRTGDVRSAAVFRVVADWVNDSSGAGAKHRAGASMDSGDSTVLRSGNEVCAQWSAASADANRMNDMSARWHADVQALEAAAMLFWTNRVEEAEAICRTGMAAAPPPPGGRDMRGAFAATGALFGVVTGLSMMEKDTFASALPRFQAAETILKDGDQWTLTKLNRGVCSVACGILLCMQMKFIQGAWQLLGAYRVLRKQTSELESLGVELGMERPFVRSVALCLVGSKQMVTSMLPPAAAKILPAQLIAGDRDTGLKMLRQCADEGGIMRFNATHLLLTYQINMRMLWFEPWDDASFAECERLISAVEQRLGRKTLFFGSKRAELLGLRHEPLTAVDLYEQLTREPTLSAPLLQTTLNWGRVKHLLAGLRWEEAADIARRTVGILTGGGKRTSVIATAMSAACIYTVVGEQKSADEMIALCTRLRDEAGKKKKWQGMDKKALGELANIEVGKPHTLWDLLGMMLDNYCFASMAAADLDTVAALLLVERRKGTEMTHFGESGPLQVDFVTALMYLQRSDTEVDPKQRLVCAPTSALACLPSHTVRSAPQEYASIARRKIEACIALDPKLDGKGAAAFVASKTRLNQGRVLTALTMAQRSSEFGPYEFPMLQLKKARRTQPTFRRGAPRRHLPPPARRCAPTAPLCTRSSTSVPARWSAATRERSRCRSPLVRTQSGNGTARVPSASPCSSRRPATLEWSGRGTRRRRSSPNGLATRRSSPCAASFLRCGAARLSSRGRATLAGSRRKARSACATG